MAQAVKAGIIKGYPDNMFRPNSLITRSEMASMIAYAMGKSDETGVSGFADDNVIPAWVRSSVIQVNKSGIIIGKPVNKFVPQDNATRAEAVTAVCNTFSNCVLTLC